MAIIVMFCLFVNALYEWSVTKPNFSVYFNVAGEYPCILVRTWKWDGNCASLAGSVTLRFDGFVCLFL